MAKSALAKQIKRGRPATGITPMIGLRASPELRRAIEKWSLRQEDKPKLSETVRRLVELALRIDQPRLRAGHDGASKAKEMARKEIETLVDPSATIEERLNRTRRLLKGPEEFRDMRSDLSKAKR